MDRSRASFLCALDALAVDDGRCRTALPPGQFTALDVERVMNTVERAIMVRAAEVMVHRAARRQILRRRDPLAPCADNTSAR